MLSLKAAENTTFTYFLRPTLGKEDRGFDSLEIETFLRPSAVHSVRILGLTIVEIDLQDYPPEIFDDHLIVHFPRFEAKDTQKIIEVVFDVKVVRSGTEFRGRIFDQHSDEVHQLVDAGDATFAYSGDRLAVTFPFSKQLLSSIQITPNPFTPNGDGINDQTFISYSILNLTKAAKVQLTIYDLSGRKIRQIQNDQLISGSYQESWNGQDEDGRLIPPGNYLYHISVNTDNRHERQSGLIVVAY